MKNALILLCVISIISCAPKEGCMDPDALNFDASAEKSGTCNYTKVIFYAGRNVVGGRADIVTKIEVFQIIVSTEELIGTIENPGEENPAPDGCMPPEVSIVHNFTSGTGETRFSTRYYYNDGTNEAGTTYFLSPEKQTECIVQNLTL